MAAPVPAEKKSSGRGSVQEEAPSSSPDAEASSSPRYVQAKAAGGAAAGGAAVGGGATGTGRGGGASAVHGIARAGVSSAEQPLPYARTIQQAFGHHDVGHVKIATDGAALAASTRLGARAYAIGDRIAFRGPPDLRLAAHEAAHTVQQRAGVHLKSGVGAPGDRYERQADEAADAVVSGRSAEKILDDKYGSGGRGVQMTCSCGGTCSSCAGGGGGGAAPEPSVQFQLDSLAQRDFEPLRVDVAGGGGGGAGGGAAGGGEAGAGGGGGGIAEAAGGGAGGGGGGGAAGAETGGGTRSAGGTAPTAEAGTAIAAPASDAVDPVVAEETARRSAAACPEIPDTTPRAETSSGGGDGPEACTETRTELTTSTRPEATPAGTQPEGPAPPEPRPTEIRAQPENSGPRLEDARRETSGERPAPEAPPPGCEPPAPADPAAGGPEAAAAAGGGGEGGGDAPAAGAQEAVAEDPMAQAIGDSLERRSEGVAAYHGGLSSIGAATARVSAAAGEAVSFEAEGPSEEHGMATAVASRSLGELGEETRGTLADLERLVPQELGDSLVGAKAEITAARNRTLDSIDAEFLMARHAAERAARSTKAMIDAQYRQTVVHAVLTTALAGAQVRAAATRIRNSIGAAERRQLGTLGRIINDEATSIERVGTEKGNEAMDKGRWYWRQFHRGRIGRKDSFLDGDLTDRRAEARKTAAMETAKGFRDGFVNEAAAQARQLRRARPQHCATVIQASVGAQRGIDQGATQVVSSLREMLAGMLAAATGERAARRAVVDGQLAAQRQTLGRQRHQQRQLARDTAYVQTLGVEHAAHVSAGQLLEGIGNAGNGIAEQLTSIRALLSATRPPQAVVLRASMRAVQHRVSSELSRLRERSGDGIARAKNGVGGSRDRALNALGQLSETARDTAGATATAFGGAMTLAAQSATDSYRDQRARNTQQLASLVTSTRHTFGCALLGVLQAYSRLNTSLRDGARGQRESLTASFQEKLNGGARSEVEREIRRNACVAARNERPAWEDIAKILLVIIVAVVVSVLLGPVVGGFLGAGLLATIATGVIVGAIAGLISSVAGQVFDNAVRGRSLTHGVGRAAFTGLVTGALGGFLGGAGGVLIQAAGRAGATVATRFAINFAADMAGEYVSQAATAMIEGRSFSEAIDPRNMNVTGFLMAGAISAGTFSPRVHARTGPAPTRGLSAAVDRAGASIRRAELRVGARLGPVMAPVRAAAGRVSAVAGRARAAVAVVGDAGSRLAGAIGRTRPMQAIAGSRAGQLLGRAARFFDHDSLRSRGERGRARFDRTRLGRLANRLGGGVDAPTPHAPTPDAPTATPHDAPTATPHDAPTATPHDAPTATPHEASTPAADRATVERTRTRSELTPAEARAERAVAERGPRREVNEPPFSEGGELPNGHPWRETPEGAFCRYSNIKCFDEYGNEIPPPPGARTTRPETATPPREGGGGESAPHQPLPPDVTSSTAAGARETAAREQASPDSIRRDYDHALRSDQRLRDDLAALEGNRDLPSAQRDAELNHFRDRLEARRHTLETARKVREGTRHLYESSDVVNEAELIIRIRERDPRAVIEAPTPFHQIAEFSSRLPRPNEPAGTAAVRSAARGRPGLVRQVRSLEEGVPVHEQQQAGTNVIVRPEDTYHEVVERLSETAGSAERAARDANHVIRTGRLPDGVPPLSDYGLRLGRLYRLIHGIEPGRVGTQPFDALLVFGEAARRGDLGHIVTDLPAAFQGRLRGERPILSGPRAGQMRPVRNPGASPSARGILGAAEIGAGRQRTLPQSGYAAESADAMLLRFTNLYRDVNPNITPEIVEAIIRQHYRFPRR